MVTLLNFEQAVILLSTQIDQGKKLNVAGDYVKADSARARRLIKLLADEYKTLGVSLPVAEPRR